MTRDNQTGVVSIKSAGRRVTPSRRAVIAGALASSAALVAGRRAAFAGEWPDRPVTVIVPYSAGGSTDIQARIISDWLGQRLGQRFVVDNRGGAGGATGTAVVARAEPNGYTLLYGSIAQLAVTPLVMKVGYNPRKDFAPIASFGIGPHVLAVHPSVPAQTLAEFIAYVKANPGKINYSSSGVGTTGHLCAALFASRAGLDIVHVPYKGGQGSIPDLLSGQVEMYFGNTAEVMGYAADGKVRMLATSHGTRLPQLPDKPAIAEIYPGFDIATWNGFLAPAGTPRPILEKIASETLAALNDPTIAKRLKDLAIIPGGVTLEALSKLIEEEMVVFGDAVKAAGISNG